MTPTPSSPVSDVSFESVNSSFTNAPTKPTSYPPHASTSTISRSSHTSLPPPPSSPLPPHLLPSSSSTRLPKARVFLSRPSSPSPSLHPTRRPTSPPTSTLPPRPRPEPRCISDLVSISTHRHHLPPDAIKFLREDPDLPPWLPSDELRDWNPTPTPPSPPPRKQDPCTESRWVTSLRNLSHLHRNREPQVNDLRGSTLEVKPPSLAERLGLPQRRRKSKGAWTVQRAHAPRTGEETGNAGVRIVEAAEFGCEGRGDEYVGFLGGDIRIREARKGKKSWWRFLRRSA